MLPFLVIAVGSGTDWITPILSTGGPFAVVFVAVLADKLGNNSERNALRQQVKELETDLRAVRLAVMQDVIPLVTRSNDLIEREGRLVERVLGVLERREG